MFNIDHIIIEFVSFQMFKSGSKSRSDSFGSSKAVKKDIMYSPCIRGSWCLNKVPHSGLNVGFGMNEFWYSMSLVLHLTSCLIFLFDLKLLSELEYVIAMNLLCYYHAWGRVNLFCYLYFMSVLICNTMLILFIGFAKCYEMKHRAYR